MKREGLSAEVPTLELCREMAAIPALAEAFKESPCAVWQEEDAIVLREGAPDDPEAVTLIPAPTVREMLAWLKLNCDGEIGASWILVVKDKAASITDPDALARACIEAAKAGAK